MGIFNEIGLVMRIQKQYKLFDNAPIANGYIYNKYKDKLGLKYAIGYMCFTDFKDTIEIYPHIFINTKDGDYVDACKDILKKGLESKRCQVFLSYKDLIEAYPNINEKDRKHLLSTSFKLNTCFNLVSQAIKNLGKSSDLTLHDYLFLIDKRKNN